MVEDRYGTQLGVGDGVEFIDGISMWARWDRRRGGAYVDGIEADGRVLVGWNDGSDGVAVNPRALRALGTEERSA